MIGQLLAAILIAVAQAPVPAPEAPPAARMLERIVGLAGEWQGTYRWSGGRTGGGDLRVVYETTGLGSAVIETLIQGGRRSMSTVYHLDGEDLRMTHYCAARNQPRLRADRIDEAAGSVRFAFVDATNIGPRNPGHVHGAELHILGPDRLQIRFTFEGGGPTAVETIDVTRVTRTAA